jgi:hypothetical protein
MATKFFDEVLRRFPEVSPFVSDGDEELPYTVAAYLVDWLRTVARPVLNPDVVRRVVDFHQWCIDQPQANTGADDVFTIETVAEYPRQDEFAPEELPKLREECLMVKARTSDPKAAKALRKLVLACDEASKRGFSLMLICD